MTLDSREQTPRRVTHSTRGLHPSHTRGLHPTTHAACCCCARAGGRGAGTVPRGGDAHPDLVSSARHAAQRRCGAGWSGGGAFAFSVSTQHARCLTAAAAARLPCPRIRTAAGHTLRRLHKTRRRNPEQPHPRPSPPTPRRFGTRQRPAALAGPPPARRVLAGSHDQVHTPAAAAASPLPERPVAAPPAPRRRRYSLRLGGSSLARPPRCRHRPMMMTAAAPRSMPRVMDV